MQADTFFEKLCQNEDYTNSRLREDCLNLLMDFPYLAEHMHYEVFSGSRVAYGIFKAIRSMYRRGIERICHDELWGECIGQEGATLEEFALASVSGDIMAMAISQLNGVDDKRDFYWKHGYCVLSWRIENDIVY